MSLLPHRRAKSTAEDVERLLAKVKVDRRAVGGGTLLTEPIIIARGTHQERLELLDQDGHQLGFADPVPPDERFSLEWLGRSLWLYLPSPTSYEIRDTDGRCVLIVQSVKLSIGERFRGLWTYEVLQPGDLQGITLSKAGRWWTRTYSIAEGPRQIGLLRSEFGTTWRSTAEWLWAIQDEPGHILGRVLLARRGSFSRRIALVLEVENRSPEQLRKAALAAIVIADLKMITFNSGSGGGGYGGG